MSRIGKLPIEIPAGVTVDINNSVVTVKGALGTLTREIDPKITVRVEGNTLHVENNNKDEKLYGAKHGLYRQLINNMVIGVSKGYEKSLTINGVGFKVSQNGANLTLNLGFSHPVEIKAVEGIQLSCDGKTIITVKGCNKELVGQVAAKIRSIKPVEPYHAYGIYYTDERVIRKEVKSGKK